MTPSRSRRPVRIIAWLLTPVVVWAASFLGGWIGLSVGRQLGDEEALLAGGIGAALGGAAAVLVWVLRLRAGARRDARAERPDAPGGPEGP